VTAIGADLFASCSAQISHNAWLALNFIFAVDTHFLATENGRTIQTKQTIGRNEPVTLGHAAEKQLSRPLEFQINCACGLM
jgi:hypothetical protein